MNTSSTPIIPVYRALTLAGNVLERDEFGEVYHIVVVDTTITGLHEVNYEVKRLERSRRIR